MCFFKPKTPLWIKCPANVDCCLPDVLNETGFLLGNVSLPANVD